VPRESVRLYPDISLLPFREASEYCGAVHVRSSELVDNFFSLFDVDGEDLVACTGDGAAGLFAASWEEPNTPGAPVYALQAWHPEAG
jgi:hypothetical protein